MTPSLLPPFPQLHFFSGSYSDYEEDRRRRTGSSSAPQRLKFRKLLAAA